MDSRLIQICSECEKASCWHGEFMCSDARGADIILKTASELDQLNLEDKRHYSVENIKEVFGEPYPNGFKEENSNGIHI